MQDFARSHIRNVSRGLASMPRPADCLVVERVAQGSVAGAAGILPGDWLVEVDGEKAAKIDPVLTHHFAAECKYRFFSRTSSEETVLEASGIPLGLELQPSAQSVAAAFDPENADTDALYALWRQGEWSTLQRLATAALDARAPSGLLGKLAGKGDRNTPSVILAGAALYERGRKKEARALFDEFMSKYADYWTQNYMGIGDYYSARDYLDSGAREEAAEAALSAHLNCACERTAELVQRVTGQRPPLDPKFWLDERFPADYVLPELEGRGGTVSLGSSLAGMGPGQVLIVCILATYRGNGPYNAFMKRFRNYATYFPEYLSELHVVTMETERRPDRPYWYEAEDVCRGEGLPFHVLLEDGGVTNAVEPTGSPSIFVLDASGTIIQEGQLMEVDFWQALYRIRMSPDDV